jgi:hypothetical protein
MRYPSLSKLVALSPRIVDLVFLAEPAGRWRRLAFGGAVVVVLYGGVFALVSRLGSSLGPWSGEMAARIHEAIAMERAVEVTPPPPPPAPSPPSAPAPEAPHIAISRSVRAPHAQEARATPPAQAGQIVGLCLRSRPISQAPHSSSAPALPMPAGATTSSRNQPQGSPRSRGSRGLERSDPASKSSPGRRARPIRLELSLASRSRRRAGQRANGGVASDVRSDGRADRVDVLSDPGFGFGAARVLCPAHALRARSRWGRPTRSPGSRHRIRVHFYPVRAMRALAWLLVTYRRHHRVLGLPSTSGDHRGLPRRAGPSRRN